MNAFVFLAPGLGENKLLLGQVISWEQQIQFMVISKSCFDKSSHKASEFPIIETSNFHVKSDLDSLEFLTNTLVTTCNIIPNETMETVTKAILRWSR